MPCIRMDANSSSNSRTEITPSSVEMETSTSNTSSVSLRGIIKNSRSNSKELINEDALGSVDPPNVVLGEPRIRKSSSSDRSSSESSDGRAIKSTGNPSSSFD